MYTLIYIYIDKFLHIHNSLFRFKKNKFFYSLTKYIPYCLRANAYLELMQWHGSLWLELHVVRVVQLQHDVVAVNKRSLERIRVPLE